MFFKQIPVIGDKCWLLHKRYITFHKLFIKRKSKYLTSPQELLLSYVYTPKLIKNFDGIELNAIKVISINIFLITSQYTYDTATKNLTIIALIRKNGTSNILHNLSFFFGPEKVINKRLKKNISISVIQYNKCDKCHIKSIRHKK
ncbi:hypothetical protein ENUP19_0276G0014 [Entamoeba nuttalli]|uniref:Ribosomal protein L14 n=1 Tax=Entamoeba nuttalli TaxID=412467 RepID=A0ABQ0DTI2_9EUKA